MGDPSQPLHARWAEGCTPYTRSFRAEGCRTPGSLLEARARVVSTRAFAQSLQPEAVCSCMELLTCRDSNSLLFYSLYGFHHDECSSNESRHHDIHQALVFLCDAGRFPRLVVSSRTKRRRKIQSACGKASSRKWLGGGLGPGEQ